MSLPRGTALPDFAQPAIGLFQLLFADHVDMPEMDQRGERDMPADLFQPDPAWL